MPGMLKKLNGKVTNWSKPTGMEKAIFHGTLASREFAEYSLVKLY